MTTLAVGWTGSVRLLIRPVCRLPTTVDLVTIEGVPGSRPLMEFTDGCSLAFPRWWDPNCWRPCAAWAMVTSSSWPTPIFRVRIWDPPVLRADGLEIAALLDGILPLFALDQYVPTPLAMMAAVAGDELDPAVEHSYRDVIDKHWPGTPAMERVERFAFYDRARSAFTIVMTGDTAKYGNLILKKGVTPVARS